jgi:integrase
MRLRKRAGLAAPDRNGERLVWYSLRHTRLTEAATKEGWSPHNLMRFAGHTNSKMTDRYVHPDWDDVLREAREGRERRLGGGTPLPQTGEKLID